MNLPRELPIWEVEQAILQGLKTHRVVIVSAETGSGKSTQIPQMLWHAGYGYNSRIGVTQPRRVAASSVAKRVAEELGVALGQEVGFQVRFEQELGPKTEIKFATEGIFLQEARSDPLFGPYSVLMLDEVHERSLDMDVLLGLVKLALAVRDDFRVVISSATVNIPALQEFFGEQAIVVECEGRVFPVEVHFEETDPSYNFTSGIRARYGEAQPRYEMAEFAADRAAALIRAGKEGDTLVFLPGYEDLRRAKEQLETACPRVEVLLAHGEMPLEQLEQLFEPHDSQRVIFATNVAETSLTIPTVTVVIDSGQVKKDFFSSRHGMVGLVLIKTSQSSCEQRTGRAGRTQPGQCYRLFTAPDYEERPLYDQPAITRSNLASVILTLASVGVREFTDFPFLDQPDLPQFEAAVASLREIGALDQANQLTDYGRQVARFPLAPERAHLLIQAHQHGALMEMATFLALSDVNPYRRFERGERKPYLELIGQCESDPEALLVIWDSYHKSRWNDGWASQNGLRPRALQEAREIRAQLLQIAGEQGLVPEASECNYRRLKAALVRSIPEHIAVGRGGQFSYSPLCDFGNLYYIHPSSLLFERGMGVRALWHFFRRVSGRKAYFLCCLPLSSEELTEFLSDTGRLTVSYRLVLYRSYSLVATTARQEVIYRELKWDGYLLIQEQAASWSTEEWQSGVVYPPATSSFSSPEVELSPERFAELMAAYTFYREHQEEIRREIEAAKAEGRRLEEEQLQEVIREATERRQLYEREESARREAAQALRKALPQLPPDAPTEVAEAWRQITEALAPEAVSTADDLIRAVSTASAFYRLLAEHRLAAEELQEALDESRLLLELHVADNLHVCPLCYSVFDESNRCPCAQGQTPSSLGLNNGDTEKDLVRLVMAGTSRVQARIFVSAPPEGRRLVIREIRPVTEPFDDIVVERPTATT